MRLEKKLIKPRIFILCNGELAEPQYFKDFKNHLRAHNVTISYKEYLRKAPWAFIDSAIKFKKELERRGRFYNDDGDQVWCVFDVDNYLDDNERNFRAALSLAQENGLQLAWSNECFELWFLCHFGPSDSGIQRRGYDKKLEKYFRDHKLGSYEKNIERVFRALLPFQKSAIKNAQKLYIKNKVEKKPSTAVFLLVEALLTTSA